MAAPTLPTQPTTFPLFLRLPYDIQVQICGLFCAHCRHDPTPLIIYTDNMWDNPVRALSQTCRTLKAIAQPIYFHCPYTRRHGKFIRHMRKYPHLAQHVRVFAHHKLYWGGACEHDYIDEADVLYLKELSDELGLGEPDDPNYDIPFKEFSRYIRDEHILKHQFMFLALDHLLTTIYFAILPKLEVAAIDLYQGKGGDRFMDQDPRYPGVPTPYFYLPRFLQNNPFTLHSLKTIVFRYPAHWKDDNLGLDRAHFIFPHIPNVRSVIFDHVMDICPVAEVSVEKRHPELFWSALPLLQEVYFQPCNRPGNMIPYTGIRNLLSQCTSLKKVSFAHADPNTFENAGPLLFYPKQAVDALLPVAPTVESLGLFCSRSMVPNLVQSSLLTDELHAFTQLSVLDLDEQVFCRHWLDTVAPPHCLVGLLPSSVCSFTLRMHDKYRAIDDVIHLGQLTNSSLMATSLTRVRVLVLYNTNGLCYIPFDEEHYLHGVEYDEQVEVLQTLAHKIRPRILAAFRNSMIRVTVEYEGGPFYRGMFNGSRLQYTNPGMEEE